MHFGEAKSIFQSMLALHFKINKLLKAPKELIYCYMEEQSYILRLHSRKILMLNICILRDILWRK